MTTVTKDESQPARDLALARREWLLATMERQRALSPIAAGIARIEGLGADDFLHHFYAPGRPVIIGNAIEHWPARARWTPDYLRRTIGGAMIDYQGGRAGAVDYELVKDQYRRSMPFDAFIDMIEASEGNEAYITAYNSRANAEALKPLMADIAPIPLLANAEGMLWIGPAGTFTPLHFDLTNNLLAQVSGTKSIMLLPPSETRKLANNRHVFSDVYDIADPAARARYPDAAEARRFEFDLNAGDMLFVPVGWWHQVRAKSFSTMLTFTNFPWPNDAWESFPRY
jgi:ribosomal protein L16 Arg81 hydroxylase